MDKQMSQYGNNVKSAPAKSLSNVVLKKLGVSDDFLKNHETMEELRKSTPNIVIGEAIKTFQFMQDRFKVQTVHKKNYYVMGLGTYQQLHFDTRHNMKLMRPPMNGVQFKKLYKPYTGQSLDNKKLLVWRTGGIGDLLFIQPNLRYLKEKYPTCKIMFACAPRYMPMVETWDCIDEILELPFNHRYLIDADYHAIFEGVIERCKEAETENSYRLFTKWLKLNLDDSELKPKLQPKKELEHDIDNFLNNRNIDKNNFILVQATSSSPIRTPHPKVMSSFIDKIVENGYQVVITDSPQKSKQIDIMINSYINNKENVFNFSPYSKGIDYSILMASKATGILSVDSSLLHIGQGVNTPIVGIYGPFPGYVRLITYDNCDWVECNTSCSPCFIHGHKPCKNARNGYVPCYENISPDEVVSKLNNLLG